MFQTARAEAAAPAVGFIELVDFDEAHGGHLLSYRDEMP